MDEHAEFSITPPGHAGIVLSLCFTGYRGDRMFQVGSW